MNTRSRLAVADTSGVGTATLAISIGSGVIAAFDDAEPTGTPVVDAVMIAVVVAGIVCLASLGPWWPRVAAAGIGAAIAVDPAGTVFGTVGLLAGSYMHAQGVPRPRSDRVDEANPADRGNERDEANRANGVDEVGRVDAADGIDDLDVADSSPTGRFAIVDWAMEHPQAFNAAIAGCAVNSLIRSELVAFAGATTLLAGALCLLMAGYGLRLRDPSVARMLRRAGLIGLGFGVAAALLVVGAAIGVRDAAGNANTAAQAGADALDDGDYEEAAEHFERANAEFVRLDSRLDGWLSLPSRIVPGLAQNVSAGARLADAGAEMSAEASESLLEIDPSTLTVSGGAIDLDALRDLQQPLMRVHSAFGKLEIALADSESPLLVPPLAARLDELDEEVTEQGRRLDNVVDATLLGPQMLGGDGPRRYLVLFTTPAEARGLGGFSGTWTTMEITDGDVSVDEISRIDELNLASEGADCGNCAPEFRQRYGRFGPTTANGLVGGDTWTNLTMSAHFPYVADAATRLFPQATGESIDGVIVMDPYVIETLVSYTGPVAIPELDIVVEPDDVAEFILREQYLLAGGRQTRLDALDSLGAGALQAVLAGDLPDPPELLADLAPLVSQRRLLMWTTDDAEQSLLDRVGLLGSLPALDPIDGGFSVSVTNASSNKIDVFLERDVDVRETPDGIGRSLVAEVTLRNGAPSSGLPDYVIGNLIDLPPGSSRLFVTFYGPPTLKSATLDGEPVEFAVLPEAGWAAYELFIEFAPGETHAFELEFALPGTPRGDDFDPTVWEQPLARSVD